MSFLYSLFQKIKSLFFWNILEQGKIIVCWKYILVGPRIKHVSKHLLYHCKQKESIFRLSKTGSVNGFMYTFSELVLEDTINFEMKDISSKRNHFSIIKQKNEMSNWYLTLLATGRGRFCPWLGNSVIPQIPRNLEHWRFLTFRHL